MARRDAASALEAHLGYWLRYVSNHVSHAFKLKVEAEGATVAEWVLLRALWDDDGAPPSRLAERLGLTRGAVSKLVDRLSAKGFVVCRADPDDRRRQALGLTASGRALVPRLARLADANDAEFFGHLSAEARGALATLLQEVVRRQGLHGVPID